MGDLGDVIWLLTAMLILMLLTTPKAESLATKIAGNLQKDIGDSGIDPGFSFRTSNEACRMSWEDPVIYSSLSESRLLAGSLRLYSKYFYAFRHGAMRRSSQIVKKVVMARREERGKWGDTAYLLRTECQTISWSFARYSAHPLDWLCTLW